MGLPPVFIHFTTVSPVLGSHRHWGEMRCRGCCLHRFSLGVHVPQIPLGWHVFFCCNIYLEYIQDFSYVYIYIWIKYIMYVYVFFLVDIPWWSTTLRILHYDDLWAVGTWGCSWGYKWVTVTVPIGDPKNTSCGVHCHVYTHEDNLNCTLKYVPFWIRKVLRKPETWRSWRSRLIF